jgi:hypothetical protein
MIFPLFSLACASGPENPSFPLKVDDARSALRQMEEKPKPLQRPVLVIGGYLDFGVTPSLVRCELRALTDDDRIAPVALFDCGDFDDCREKVIAAVDKAFPNKDPEFTTPVDVIGVSMGGLAARYAAAPDPSGKSHRRLKIARLFTISSPHQGAVAAAFPSFHKLVWQMRQGSEFLGSLEQARCNCGYEIYPYVRLNDGWVGESNAAPPGQTPWWVPSPILQPSHLGAAADPRILADIARRLRGEEPFTRGTPAPLPGSGGEEGAHS